MKKDNLLFVGILLFAVIILYFFSKELKITKNTEEEFGWRRRLNRQKKR
tara:strand:+ start:1342 stop:1488 length:147 start_codon:yes stop_codon:yes gene_type:complete